MGLQKRFRRPSRVFVKCAISFALIFLSTSLCVAQAKQQPEMPWSQDLKKYPGLMEEFQRLFSKVQSEVQPPPVRKQSNLLPLLPDSTLYYVALPNYGEAAHKGLNIFEQELRESAVLRDWWQHGELAKNGPAAELAIEKLYEFSQYIGDEVVISGGVDSPERGLLVIAEVRQPGLKDFVQQTLKQIPSSSKLPIRVLDAQELAVAKDDAAAQELVLLVRPDFVIAAPSVKAVRSFNELLESKTGGFASTAFGERLAHAYGDGVSALAGADLQKLIKQIPPAATGNPEILARTGFADMKYLIWEHKSVAGQPASQTELSFTGPRHGVASWLAAPSSMNSLDFASPKAILTSTLVLKNWAEIFDDIQALATYANPNAWASINQMQQAMNLNIKNDLLSHFEGEITLELDSLEQPSPAWKAILRVNHPEALQKTLNKLLASGPFTAEQFDEGGVQYHALHIPSAAKPVKIVYAVVDGYLVVASSHEAAAEAIQLHKSGGSLRSSPKLTAALPPGHSGASALFYEDPAAMAAFGLRLASPEVAQTVLGLRQNAPPIVIAAYGEESAIRVASTNASADAGAVMIGAAIAIPNLLRSRIAANEASAVATMRTLAVAQITYSATYPQKGFARDMASLGPDPRGPKFVSAQHSSMVNPELGGPNCTAGAWCTRSGYNFAIKAVCGQTLCKDFVATATPVSVNTGTKNFCSTSDGVVRYNIGAPLTQPVSVSQCKAWMPLR